MTVSTSVLVNALPLLGAVLLILAIVATRVSRRFDRVVTRLSLVMFGRYVARVGRKREARRQALRAAQIPVTYRTYGAKTWFLTGVAAVAGSVLGVYAVAGLLWAMAIDPQTLEAVLPSALGFLTNVLFVPQLTLVQLLTLVLASSATFGLFAGVTVYSLRWWLPVNTGANRRRRIDASMPRTVAFIFALSRSGMAFPQVMRVLAENRAIYGDAADEVAVAVNDMDIFGVDVITAIRTMADRTPSEQFEEFSENLANVLQSGQSLAAFLREQYDRYQEEIEAQQNQLLNLLATLAEVYVSVLVAGPLFFITILVIIGITVSDTLLLIRLTVYLILPLANLVFIVYLSTITESLRSIRDRPVPEDPLGGVANVRRLRDERERQRVAADGGSSHHENRQRLATYRRFHSWMGSLSRPVETMLRRPIIVLYLTVPIAVIATALRLPTAIEDGTVSVAILDDLLVQGTVFVIGTYALVAEVRQRRLRRIERIVPDFLDRLASINEAGMSVVESVGRVRRSDLGALDPEIDRLWRDIEWGADLETAFRRFERRVQTMSITRIVTLITNAIASSGDIAPVLRIAADQGQADRRLKRQRNQEMFTYLVVIYVAFLVFFVIIFALNNVLIPSLPQAGPPETGATSAAVTGLADIDPEAYTMVFLHTVLIQGFLSGLIAGQMGGGSLRDGAKHATILVLLAYLGFAVIT